MSIKTKCPGCNATLKLKDTLIGQQVNCPRCDGQILVTANNPAEPDENLLGDNAWLEEEEFATVPDPYDTQVGTDLANPLDDEYGDELFSAAPVRRKKKKKKSPAPAPTESPPVDTTKNKYITIAVFGGMFLAGVLISLAVVAYFNADGGTDNEATDGSAEVDASGFSDTEDMVEELDDVLSDMESLLEDGQHREFIVRYAPLTVLAALKEAETQKTPPPSLPRDRILKAIEKLSGRTPEVEAEGWVAELKREESVNAEDTTATKGYGSDIQQAIAGAVKDLQAGRYDQFVEKFVPESAKLQMAGGPAEQSTSADLSADSPLVIMMLADLKRLQHLTPEISGNTAVFHLPPYEPEGELAAALQSRRSHQPGDREIRFSLIAGSWRLYDNLSDMPDLAGTAVYQLTFERVGRTWRLSHWP